MIPCGRGDDHTFTDETTEEGKTGDSKCANHVKRYRPGHGSIEAAEFGQFTFTGHVDDSASPHKQQAFIEDMREGVGRTTVQGHFGADTNACDHIPDLTDNMIAEQATTIIFQHGEYHPIEGHKHPKTDQDVCAGVGADHHINRGFGGKGT